MECENCRKEREHGRLYGFHYGKKVAETERIELDLARIKQSYYRIAGMETAWICDRCSNRMFSTLFTIFFIAGLFILIMALLISFSETIGSGSPLLFLICLGASFFLACGIAFILKKRWQTGFGEAYALKIKKKALQLQGYDAFFTSREYRGLEGAK